MKELKDFGLMATDGEIGSVDDFYFDDRLWLIRYLVLKTHAVLPGRVVLISPRALKSVDWERRVIITDLTQGRIEKSPEVDTHQPVSRQSEEELSKYYGWPPYWLDTDIHLQSSNDVTRYRISATDGDIGKVDDFIVEDDEWRIRYMVVDTNEWLPGKKVLLSLDWIREISAEPGKVHVDLLRDQISKAPEFDPRSLPSREYETELYGYYGKAFYWNFKGDSHA